jgi:hypothetical protein
MMTLLLAATSFIAGGCSVYWKRQASRRWTSPITDERIPRQRNRAIWCRAIGFGAI